MSYKNTNNTSITNETYATIIVIGQLLVWLRTFDQFLVGAFIALTPLNMS